MLGKDIGVDLGTASVLIYVRKEGVVLREPSVVAIDRDTNEVLAVGEEAKKMLGRTPSNVVAICPMKDGVIADYRVTETMLRYFLQRVCGSMRFFRPRVMICVPSGATDVEKRAVLDAAVEVGARDAYLIEEPMAAAIGAGLDVSEPHGNMIVDIGGGTTDIAVISLGGIVQSESLRVAGNRMDEYILRYIRKKYNLLIGDQTAENLKIKIGTVMPREKVVEVVRGRDLVRGLPKMIEITNYDIAEAISEPVKEIINGIKRVLELTPPELAADIIDRGIVLTGGGALLDGFAELVAKETEIPAYVADDPLECVALGTGKALEELDKLKLTPVKRR